MATMLSESKPRHAFALALVALAVAAAALMASSLGPIQLRYRLHLIERDSTGTYVTSGVIKGEIQGRATVRFSIDSGSTGRPGIAPVHTSWVVLAEPDSDSFQAELQGTLEVVSGQTHLVGTITSGARRGHRVETASRLLNFGANGEISDVDGLMIIGER